LSSKPARSYDGDENATKESASTQVEALPEPMETSAINGNIGTHDEVKQENVKQEQSGIPDHDQHAYGSGQNGNAGSSWNDGHGNGAQGNSYGDVAVEPEQHGIGIKEDG